MFAQAGHQVFEFFITMESWRAASKVKLNHLPVVIEQLSLQFNFTFQQFQVNIGLVIVPGDLFHASAVITK